MKQLCQSVGHNGESVDTKRNVIWNEMVEKRENKQKTKTVGFAYSLV